MATTTKKINKITNEKDIDMFLNLKEEDITSSFIMENFAQFNGNPPKFNVYDEIVIPKGAYGLGDIKNTQSFTTTLGAWVFNKFFIEKDLIHIFGYENNAISNKYYGKMNKKLSYALLEDDITLDQLKHFLEKTQQFMPYVSILSPSVTMKLLLCDKVIAKEKERLVRLHKAEIDAGNEIVTEQIEKELLKFAQEYLEGDDSMECYDSGARMKMGNHFKNMNIMRGAAKDPDPDKGYNIMLSNYMSGITAEDYAKLCNTMAAGPYSRGKKTAIGGYWEKLFVSAFQHLRLDPPGTDCGTKDTLTIKLNNPEDYIYSYIVENGKLIELTSKNMDKYKGKTVKMRFSSLCKSKTGFCNHCAGNLFYRIGGFENIGVALALIPSILKNTSMKAFHDSTVKMVEIDIEHAFGQD